MKKEWFEPGPDGVSRFERLSATVGFGAAGTAAAFRMLLSEETSNDVTSLRTEIYQLRESLERSRQAVNTTREQRDRFWSQRDAARAEVERLTVERDSLQACLLNEQAKRESIEAELAACRQIRNALQARIDAGVRVWGDHLVWGQLEEHDTHTGIVIDVEKIRPDAGKMVDERTGPADRRYEVWDNMGDCPWEVRGDCGRWKKNQPDRRRTPGTRADRRA